MPPDYSNTVIYRLYCIDPDIDPDYIGHSADFHKRKIVHKNRCNNNKNSSKKEYHSKVYKYIRENGGYDNWKFEILEYADLKDKDEAETLEGDYIEIFNPTLNKNDVGLGLTPDEKAEYKIAYDKKRREDPEFRKKNVEREKKWRADNPERAVAIAAASNAKSLEKYTCVCGVIHSWGRRNKHLDTLKHKKFLKNNPQEA